MARNLALFVPFLRSGLAFWIFGPILALIVFRRTLRFKRATGRSPWHIHPLIWGVATLFVSIFGTLLALVAMATTRRSSARPGTAEVAGAVGPAPLYAAAPPGWHADPEGPGRLRYWDGWSWTEHVRPAADAEGSR